MPLTDLKTLLEKAEQNKFAVGAFEVWNLESIQIVVSPAEKLHSPVILAIGTAHGFYKEKPRLDLQRLKKKGKAYLYF